MIDISHMESQLSIIDWPENKNYVPFLLWKNVYISKSFPTYSNTINIKQGKVILSKLHQLHKNNNIE